MRKKKSSSPGRAKRTGETAASGSPRSDGKARTAKRSAPARQQNTRNRRAGANSQATDAAIGSTNERGNSRKNSRAGRTRINTTASTQPRGTKKERSTAAPATSQDPIRFPDETRPMRKTRLSDKDLAQFRDLLLRKRGELCGDLARLSDEALSGQGRGRGEASAMPIHMADLGSDNWEQEFNLGLLANEQALIREIDEALERIENRTYGICLGTGKPIRKARLRATPWTKYCIEYARAREEGRAV